MRDLAGIREYIAQDSDDRAVAFTELLVEAINRLASFPRAGRPVPELPHSALREHVSRDYRVIYEVRGERVVILAVLHGSMSTALQAQRRRWNT